MPISSRILQAPLAHHDGSELYVDNLQPDLGDTISLAARISASLQACNVYLRCVTNGEPTYVPAKQTRSCSQETWWTASVHIVNIVTSYRFFIITQKGLLWLNAGGLHTHDVPDAQDFKLTINHIPSWVEDAIIYQIFPDRFARSATHRISRYPNWSIPVEWNAQIAANTPEGIKQIYGGTLWGIEEHLNYIKSLGANVIYLTPFFPAQSNHRYDASTFDTVDPLLGGDKALKQLIDSAHRQGIRVIGDLTLNHSGVTHDWFKTGQANPESPEADFYYFDQTHRNSYVTFGNAKTLPKFNHQSFELRRRLYSGKSSIVSRYIRDFDLDGWRIDVAQSAGKYNDADFTDEIAKLTRKTMKETRKDTLLIAEHQFDATSVLQGDEWQGTMAYAAFTKPVWAWLGENQRENEWGMPGGAIRYTGTQMVQTMMDFISLIPWQSYISSMMLLDSHDTSRFRTISGKYQELGIALLMTLPGMPMIFSGDEVGVFGEGLEGGRVPFPWNQSSWDMNCNRLYKGLISLRHQHNALHNGGLRWYYNDSDTVIFERANAEESLLIEVSRAEHDPLVSTINAENLTNGPDLIINEKMPSNGPAFHIWKITD